MLAEVAASSVVASSLAIEVFASLLINASRGSHRATVATLSATTNTPSEASSATTAGSPSLSFDSWEPRSKAGLPSRLGPVQLSPAASVTQASAPSNDATSSSFVLSDTPDTSDDSEATSTTATARSSVDRTEPVAT